MSKNPQMTALTEAKQRKALVGYSMLSQVENMKMHCVKHCFDLSQADISDQEKACFSTCLQKAQAFTEKVSEVYRTNFF
jgi:hypothetical protein